MKVCFGITISINISSNEPFDSILCKKENQSENCKGKKAAHCQIVEKYDTVRLE